MKKKLFIIAILFSIFSFISLKALSSKAASNINKPIVNIVEEQKIVKNNIQKIIDNNVYLANNNTYFINENIIIEGKINNYIYNKDSIIFTIKESDGTIICKYNQTLKDKQLIDKLPITINDMVVYNEQLIVVGEEKNDACIYTYTIDGTQINKYQYGGNAKESFLKIQISGNYIYLIGQKNGISEGSIFKNVGNDADIKPFIIRMNSSFKIVNEFYINEKTKLEKIKNFAFNSNISFTIETFDKRFFHYELDNELKLIKHYELLPPIKYKDITKLNNNCYLLETLNTYYLGFKLSNSWHLIPLTDIDEINYTNLINGNVIITNYSNNQIKTYKISEYHIEYINDFIYQYPYLNYQSTNHFKVESYLEDLEFIYDSVANQSINLQKSNTYIAKYYAIKQDGTRLDIETNYIVQPFINIVDEGVYPVGYKLLFTDEVMVNDTKAINGESLNSVGTYQRKHNGKSYKIYVKEKTYHNFDKDYLEADYILTKDDNAIYKVILSTNKQIKRVIVNEKDYPFIQNNDELILNFALGGNDFISYYIDSVVFSDDTTLKINQYYKLKRVSTYPILKLTYENDTLNYQINDEDKTIFDVVVKMYKETTLLEEVHTFLEDTNINFNVDANKVEVLVRYHLEGKTIEEVNLIDLVATKKSKKDNNLELTFGKNNDMIENIKIKVNEDSLKVKNVSAQKIDLTKAYQTNDNKLICYISIIITIILAIIIISVIIRRHIKKSEH